MKELHKEINFVFKGLSENISLMCLEQILKCQRKYLCHLIANWIVTSTEVKAIQATIISDLLLLHLVFAHLVHRRWWISPLASYLFSKQRPRNHPHYHLLQRAACKSHGETPFFPCPMLLSVEWSCRWHITFAAYIDLWFQSAEQTTHFFPNRPQLITHYPPFNRQEN